MPNICYMLVGLPGSGKSTASSLIIQNIANLEILSSDKYIESHALTENKTYSEVYADFYPEAQRMMKLDKVRIIQDKQSFIWDQTNVQPLSRLRKVKHLKQSKYTVVGIVIELSLEELEKRQEKRLRETGKRISPSVIKNLAEEYIRPSYEEGFDDIYLIQDDNIPVLLDKPIENTQVKCKP